MKAWRRAVLAVYIVFGAAVALAFGARLWTPPPPATTGIVQVITLPITGADIYVNDHMIGKSPATIEGLPPGTVIIQAKHPDYKPRWRQVTPPPNGELLVELELTPRVGYVTFESVPPLAEIWVDDTRKLGETPITTPVPAGVHTYELRLQDHKPLRVTLTIEEDYRYSYRYLLEPMDGTIEITSAPASADIWINDQIRDIRTPATLTLPPGPYRVAVHRKGYVMREDIVDLPPNSHRRVHLVMEEGDTPPGMILIPAGEFFMGVDNAAPDESPQQAVFLPAFYIDRYEVTNRQYAAVVRDHKYDELEANFPASGLTWRQADAYCKAIGKRLPTEAEWEKAARGTDKREYPWGNEWDPKRCNAAQGPTAVLKAVGEYRHGASPYGCLDMAGNGKEWTASWYEPYPGNKQINQDYGQVFRVIRGGSYLSDRYDVRCARRMYDRMDVSEPDYCVRCAQDVVSARDKAATRP